MDYYQKNLECIKNNRDFMYNSMLKADAKSTLNQLDEIHSIQTKDNKLAVLIKYKSVEYRLNSIYRPDEEAKKWAEQYKLQNLSNLVSMFGMGNGVFARAIIEKMSENDTLLIYEPSAEIFYHVIENYDITDILANQRVSISVESINEFEYHNAIRGVMNITNMNNQIICVLPQYDKVFAESCVDFWKELKDCYINAKMNINTEIIFGKRYLDNLTSNIKFLNNSNSLDEIKDDFPEDIAAIIIGAGPSVENHIEDLKRAKGKAVIIAVDRILDFLLSSGLEPDFIMTLDPIKPIEYFTNRTDITIPLFCFLQANSEILNHHAGRKIICNCTEFLSKVYEDANKTPPMTKSSSSVATVALSACVELKMKHIILVGQDLAYNGNNTHAGGIEEATNEAKIVMVEDIHGNMVKSRYDWKEIVTWYQDMLTVYPDLKIIDAKENGAKIKGTTVMPVKDAIELYCNIEFDCKSMMEKKAPTFDAKGIYKIKRYLEDNLDILYKIKKKSIEAIEACKILINEEEKQNHDTEKTNKAVKKLSKINKYIADEPIYAIMDQLIMASSAQHLLEISQFTNNIKEDSLNTFEKSICVFEAVLEAIEYIKPRLQQAVDEIIIIE